MITDFEWQDFPGQCPCGHEFMDFLRDEKVQNDFKDCLGFVDIDPCNISPYRCPKEGELIIGFECPECFVKSGFHVDPGWEGKYGKWIKER